jgi:hypothetical protein
MENILMKKIKTISLGFIFSFFWVTNLLGNIAMPGFWNVGGNGSFIPFFQEDDIHVGKVQMQKELITIQLYKGFAVVKGEYEMLNLTNEQISMHLGYPINGTLHPKYIPSVLFDDIYGLKVLVEGREMKHQRLSSDTLATTSKPSFLNLENPTNWYVWQNTFAPQTITKITVYFMVYTNAASILEGYTKNHNNGFTYILESGKVWANKIEKGRIFIQLMDKLSDKEVMGIAPIGKFLLNVSKNQILYDFKNLEPDSSSNVVLRYGEQDRTFDFKAFEALLPKAKTYYQAIDKINTAKISLSGFKPFDKSNFKVKGKVGSGMYNLFNLFLFWAFPLILIVLGAMTLRFFMKKNRK